MEPFSIGLMLLSAAMAQQAQSSALKKQQQQAVQAQQRQLQMRNQATGEAMKRVQEFDPQSRNDKQQDIAQELTGDYEREVTGPQLTAQGIQVGTTLPQGQGGTEYLTTRAKEQAKSAASLRELAALMGRIGSQSELRRGEAIGIGDTAGNIGRIQTGAGNMWQADQVGINSVRPNPFAMLASSALGAYGSAAMGGAGAKGLHGSAGGNLKFPEYGMASGPTGAWV